MDKLGVAIIGSGGMSAGHAEAFRKLSDKVNIMAFTDIDLSRARARAEQFGAPIAVRNYQEVLKRDDIHIISIVSPPYLHCQTITDSLAANKHVLCEKPVVLNLDQLDEVEKMVNTSGRVFGGCFQWRFGTSVQIAKHLYEKGMFGNVIYASSQLYWHRTQKYFDVDWRNTWKKSGGGIMFTLACHGLDVLIYILGDIDHVWAETATLKFSMEIEDTGTVILRFRNKAMAHIAATVCAQQQRSRLEIIGTKLEAISSDDPYGVAFEPWEFRSIHPDYEQQVREYIRQQNYQYVPAGHQRLIEDFINAVLKGKQPAVNISEIRRSLQVLTAIYKSNRLNKRVDLPIEKNDQFYSDLNPRI